MDGLLPHSLERGDTADETEAQRDARDAIMQIPAFPELERRLVSVCSDLPVRLS